MQHNKLPFFMKPYYPKHGLENALVAIASRINPNRNLEQASTEFFNGICGGFRKNKLLYSLVGGMRKRDIFKRNNYTNYGLLLMNWIMQLKAGDRVCGVGPFENTELEIISVSPLESKGWRIFSGDRIKNGHRSTVIVDFEISAKIIQNLNSHLPNGKIFSVGRIFNGLSNCHIFPLCVIANKTKPSNGSYQSYYELNGHTISNEEDCYTNGQEYQEQLKLAMKDRK